MKDELFFCDKWCGRLYHEQKIMVEHHIKKGSFVGVSRPLGGCSVYPLVKIGEQLNVIDRSGHYQIASLTDCKGYQCDNT